MEEQVKTRQEGETTKSILTHSFSPRQLSDYPQLVEKLLLIKMSCALANEEAKNISSTNADAIITACKKLIKEKDFSWLANDPFQGGGGVGINYSINEFIVETSKDEISLKEVNASQSTSDVVYSALALSLQDYAESLCYRVAQTIQVLENQGRQWHKIMIPARTCMQLASEAPLGSLFSGYSKTLKRSLTRLKNMNKEISKINLGGTAFGSKEGTSSKYLLAIKKILPQILDEKVMWRTDLYDCAQNVDTWTRYSQELSLLSGSLIKMAQDIRLMSIEPENNLGILDIPYTIKGSSFYPNKKNPTLPETLIQCAFLVKGQTNTIELAHEHAELQLNIYTPFIGIMLIEQMSLLTKSLNKFTTYCLTDLKPYKDKFQLLKDH